MLNRSPFLGPIFEGFVAAEIVKARTNTGRARSLYYFRDPFTSLREGVKAVTLDDFLDSLHA